MPDPRQSSLPYLQHQAHGAVARLRGMTEVEYQRAVREDRPADAESLKASADWLELAETALLASRGDPEAVKRIAEVLKDALGPATRHPKATKRPKSRRR